MQRFRRRARSEKNKFFKGKPAVNGEEFSNLDVKEKEALSNLDSAFSYLTPSQIVVGRKTKEMLKISEQIFDNSFFNQLSLMKSSGHKKTKIDSGFNLSGDANLAKATSLFGFTIAPPFRSNVEKLLEAEEDFIDVREYLGDNSFLSIEEDPLLKVSVPTLSTQEKEDSKRLVANFAELKISTRKTRNLNLKSFDLRDAESNFNSFIGNSKSSEKLRDLPVSIKALLLDTEDNKTVRFSMVGGEFDPLRNVQTQESIKENFLNIKKVEYLFGFKKINGSFDMNQPIWRLMRAGVVGKNKNYLCRLSPFEDTVLGISRPESDAPTLDSLFLIRGKK